MSDGSSGAMTDTVPQSGSLDYEALSYVPYDQHGSEAPEIVLIPGARLKPLRLVPRSYLIIL